MEASKSKQYKTQPALSWWLIFIVLWSGVIILFTLQIQIVAEFSFPEAFIRSFLRWCPWVLFSPAIFALTTRFPMERNEKLAWNILIHLVSSVVFAISAHTLVDNVIIPMEDHIQSTDSRTSSQSVSVHRAFPPRGHGPGPPPEFRPEPPPPHRSLRLPSRSWLINSISHLPRTLPMYWALVGIQSMILFASRLGHRERESIALKGLLAKAQLDALKNQLQPHFLFNTLNAISALVHSDSKAADRMINHLSTLLRGVLTEKDNNELPISRELELLRAYMAIEKVRFGERVNFEEIIGEDCLSASVPTLLLQPIVENAVRHGLEPIGKPGFVRVSASRCGNNLILKVEDNVVGLNASRAAGLGIGLSNAKAKLETLYGHNGYRLTIEDRPHGGTSVDIQIPFNTSGS